MTRSISRSFASLVAGALVLSAAAAHAEFPFRGSGWSISPSLGVLTSANNPEGAPGTADFAISADLDYNLSPNLTLGGLLNLGFGSSSILFDVGPELKYLFNINQGPHVPYLKGAFLIRYRHLSIDTGFGSSQSAAGIGIQFGGGYKYFVKSNLGVGIDLGFVPSWYFFDTTQFIFGVHILFGITYVFG